MLDIEKVFRRNLKTNQTKAQKGVDPFSKLLLANKHIEGPVATLLL